jgi:hypothetical protein
MNETYESIIGQERQIPHPARTSVLQRGPSAQISPRDATKKIVTNDNASKLQEGELPSRADGEPSRALLVSPSPMFGTTLVAVLRQIDVGCQITRTPRFAEPFFVNDQELYSLIVIDLDVFPRDGKALIGTITARQPRTPIVAFSDSSEQKLTEVTMESNLVIYFTKASPRLLIEGVLRLIIDAQPSRPPQNNGRRR